MSSCAHEDDEDYYFSDSPAKKRLKKSLIKFGLNKAQSIRKMPHIRN